MGRATALPGAQLPAWFSGWTADGAPGSQVWIPGLLRLIWEMAHRSVIQSLLCTREIIPGGVAGTIGGGEMAKFWEGFVF